MLTVVVVLEASGYSSTLRPLSRAYSVTPSMEMTFLAAVGAFFAAAAPAGFVVAAR